MGWKKFADEKPEEGKLLNFFKPKNERYMVGYFEFEPPETEFWVLHTGTCRDADPEDLWQYLNPVTMEKTYS